LVGLEVFAEPRFVETEPPATHGLGIDSDASPTESARGGSDPVAVTAKDPLLSP
jgi:hypothetical protein